MKVFISYSHIDKEKALTISDKLKENNFEVLGDFDLKLGENFRKALNRSLIEADAIIFIITKDFNNSKDANEELLKAYSYFIARNTPQLIPIIFKNAEVPIDLRDMLYLSADHEDFNSVIVRLIANLDVIRNKLEAEKNEKVKNEENFRTSLTEYIKKALERLEKNEYKNRKLAYLCYLGSGVCIFVAILLYIFKNHIIYSADTWQTIIANDVINIFLIVMILALSRLFFVLGKSFMVESIRNSDRIHAISFGEFFLNAYGNIATRDEVREVFGNWNIDNGSSFMTQSPKDYDPQIIENCIKVAELIKNQVKK